jgi:hypothetical protein
LKSSKSGTPQARSGASRTRGRDRVQGLLLALRRFDPFSLPPLPFLPPPSFPLPPGPHLPPALAPWQEVGRIAGIGHGICPAEMDAYLIQRCIGSGTLANPPVGAGPAAGLTLHMTPFVLRCCAGTFGQAFLVTSTASNRQYVIKEVRLATNTVTCPCCPDARLTPGACRSRWPC